MKKKELLIVFFVVTIILVLWILIPILLTPKISDVVDNTKYQTQLKLLNSGAETYVRIHRFNIASESLRITQDELIEDGLISAMHDPNDDKILCDGYVIVKNINSQYTYTSYLKCGKNFKSKNYEEQ